MLKMYPNVPDAVYYFISNQVNTSSEIELQEKEKKKKKGKAKNYDFLQIWIGKLTEVGYTDLVSSGNFIGLLDRPSLICACLVGLLYIATFILKTFVGSCSLGTPS